MPASETVHATDETTTNQPSEVVHATSDGPTGNAPTDAPPTGPRTNAQIAQDIDRALADYLSARDDEKHARADVADADKEIEDRQRERDNLAKYAAERGSLAQKQLQRVYAILDELRTSSPATP